MKHEWLTTNPLKNLSLKIEKVDKEYLTEEELRAIREKDIKIDRIAQVI
jgi:hypothetical protein